MYFFLFGFCILGARLCSFGKIKYCVVFYSTRAQSRKLISTLQVSIFLLPLHSLLSVWNIRAGPEAFDKSTSETPWKKCIDPFWVHSPLNQNRQSDVSCGNMQSASTVVLPNSVDTLGSSQCSAFFQHELRPPRTPLAMLKSTLCRFAQTGRMCLWIFSQQLLKVLGRWILLDVHC
jgi:hypothetical protein